MSDNTGSVYGVELIDSLPVGDGPMRQAMPSRGDLVRVRSRCERMVAGYEVLLEHYRRSQERLVAAEALLRDREEAANWCFHWICTVKHFREAFEHWPWLRDHGDTTRSKEGVG